MAEKEAAEQTHPETVSQPAKLRFGRRKMKKYLYVVKTQIIKSLTYEFNVYGNIIMPHDQDSDDEGSSRASALCDLCDGVGSDQLADCRSVRDDCIYGGEYRCADPGEEASAPASVGKHYSDLVFPGRCREGSQPAAVSNTRPAGIPSTGMCRMKYRAEGPI